VIAPGTELYADVFGIHEYYMWANFHKFVKVQSLQ